MKKISGLGFDKEKVSDYLEILDEKYKIGGGNYHHIDYSLFTKENFDSVIDKLKDALYSSVEKESEIAEKEPEKIICFDEKTNKFFNELFKDEDLIIFGHGGAAEKIMESGEFRCRYANLGSHFLGLEKTNSSLAKLNSWPHMNCPQVAIMALNRREFMPLYYKRSSKSQYDTDNYSIPTEYFVGYYDASKGEFILNPNFKKRHELDPSLTLYYNEEKFSYPSIANSDQNVRELYYELRRIGYIMYTAGETLDKKGFKQLEKQIEELMLKTYEYQSKLTSEYLIEAKEKEEKERSEADSIVFDDEWENDNENWHSSEEKNKWL